MWAADPKSELSPWVSIPFLVVWCAFLGPFLVFNFFMAPKALDRWARDRGYKLIRKTPAGLIRRASVRASNVQVVYKIVVDDGTGTSRSGLVTLGNYRWPILSWTRCPIEVHWDEAKKVPNLWDREIDGF